MEEDLSSVRCLIRRSRHATIPRPSPDGYKRPSEGHGEGILHPLYLLQAVCRRFPDSGNDFGRRCFESLTLILVLGHGGDNVAEERYASSVKLKQNA